MKIVIGYDISSQSFMVSFGHMLLHNYDPLTQLAKALYFQSLLYITDRNILEDSYQSVKHFLNFPSQKYILAIAISKQKFLIKRSNSVLLEWEIREMFYQLVGIVKNIFISEEGNLCKTSLITKSFQKFGFLWLPLLSEQP